MLPGMTSHGRVVWYELLTSDPKGAVAFYTEVFGWKTQSWGDYTMWDAGQGPLGGVTRMPEQAKAMGAPPYWQGSIQVDSVDATVDRVQQLGGKIYVVEDVPDVGRLAVIVDPQGAVVSVFTPNRGAKVLNGPMEVPGGQRVVQLADPQGAVFALVTPPKA